MKTGNCQIKLGFGFTSVCYDCSQTNHRYAFFVAQSKQKAHVNFDCSKQTIKRDLSNFTPSSCILWDTQVFITLIFQQISSQLYTISTTKKKVKKAEVEQKITSRILMPTNCGVLAGAHIQVNLQGDQSIALLGLDQTKGDIKNILMPAWSLVDKT